MHTKTKYAIVLVYDYKDNRNSRGIRMKKVLKILLGFVIFVYVVIAILTTVFLLNRNDYNVSVFGDRALLIAKDDELLPFYSNGTLLVIEKIPSTDVKIGEKGFFYDVNTTDKIVKYAEITKKENIAKDTTYTAKDNSLYSNDYFIGVESSTKEYKIVGQILNVLQSKWGFLFIIVFPLFLAFIYEIYVIVNEFKKS